MKPFLKKMIIALLILSMALSIVACGTSAQNNSSTISNSSVQNTSRRTSSSNKDNSNTSSFSSILNNSSTPSSSNTPGSSSTPSASSIPSTSSSAYDDPSTCVHSYASTVTKEATCKKPGTVTNTCSLCGDTKTETILALGHTLGTNLMCTVCGETYRSKINTSEDELEASKQVDNMLFGFVKSGSTYYLNISFFTLTPACYVDIIIKNNNGETVYNSTKTIRQADYTLTATDNLGEVQIANIIIKESEITKGKVSDGTLEVHVYDLNYFYASINDETVENLPLSDAEMVIPTLPNTIYYYGTDGRIQTSVKITAVTFKYETLGYSFLYFTGEKLYDKEGDSYSRGCKIGWKIYDSEGYLIDSGTHTTPAVKVGEKFKDDMTYIAYNKLKKGETYRLEILNVG